MSIIVKLFHKASVDIIIDGYALCFVLSYT